MLINSVHVVISPQMKTRSLSIRNIAIYILSNYILREQLFYLLFYSSYHNDQLILHHNKLKILLQVIKPKI